ncbi:MAG TPA: flagellar hook-basal body complex protein FliE [Terriglobales bacterium]|jgi:flagellar hook-basal body complex protein FliE
MMIPPITPPVFTPRVDPAGAAGADSNTSAGASFAQEMQGALQQMETLQSNAATQVSQLVNGSGGDVHASMIAVEKSDLAFGLMLQLRNKAVAAYQDISHMAF